MTHRKTFILSIDSGCWDYLDPLLDQGRMPNLERLIRQGSRGVLESTMPPITPVAFASFITGLNPGKHGIFDWAVRQGRGFQSASAVSRRGTPFWRYLNAQGVRVGLLNIPMTYPPQPLDGFLIAGIVVPRSARDFTYPRSLLEAIEQRHGPYEVEISRRLASPRNQVDPGESANPSIGEPGSAAAHGGDPEAYLRAWLEQERRQTDIALELIDEYQVDVLAFNYVSLDRLNHFASCFEHVERALENVDAQIGRFMERFPEANYIIMSDHGSRRIRGAFLLGKWLAEHGYLRYGEQNLRIPRHEVNFVLARLFQEHYGWRGAGERIARRLLGGLLQVFPPVLLEPLWKRLAAQAPDAFAYRFTSRVDWPRTQVYARSPNGPLFINLRGRDEHGWVRPGRQYEAIREAVIADLRRVRDPFTGEPLFQRIYRREELYQGEAAAEAPDIILDPYGSSCDLIVDNSPQAFHFVNRLTRFGDHSHDGLFVLSGPDFARLPGGEHRASILDIPATLLHLYNVPIPENFDGRVLTDLLAVDFLRRHPVRTQAADGDGAGPQREYSDEEMAQLTEHLRELGYL